MPATRHVPPVHDDDRIRRRRDRNPYKGLRAFEESDAADFFGRDDLVEDLVTRLADGARFITVIGPSGSGKSSLVRAGLLPAVRRGAIEGSGSWFVTSMTPSDDPLAELAMAIGRVAVRPVADLRQLLGTTGGFGRAVRAALPDDGSELLLIVDQLEECFTVCQDEEARRTFFEGLAHAAFDARSQAADRHDVARRLLRSSAAVSGLRDVARRRIAHRDATEPGGAGGGDRRAGGPSRCRTGERADEPPDQRSR